MMRKRDTAILLGIVLVIFGGVFVVPRLSLTAKKAFDPSQIARTIVHEVGQPGSAFTLACDALSTQLHLVYEGLMCSSSRYPASEATERVNHVVHSFRARPTSGWQIGEFGLIRNYRNPNQVAPGAARQMVFVVVTNNLVLVGYND